MTAPGQQIAPAAAYTDRSFRSPFGVAGGVALLTMGAFLAGDVLAHGGGRTLWLTLAGLLTAVPLVVAFTVRPVVHAGDARMVVRNPLRTITIPWARVEELRSGYSSEVLADGRRYQLWSIPVSLRARQRAVRHTARAAAAAPGADPVRAPGDEAIDDLRGLAERNAANQGANGEITVRWAYEVMAPAAVGVITLAALLATG